MPAENGSVTPSVAAAATAASTAFPPRRSTSRPTRVASASTVVTAPPYPVATGTLSVPGCAGCAEAGAPPIPRARVTAATSATRELVCLDSRMRSPRARGGYVPYYHPLADPARRRLLVASVISRSRPGRRPGEQDRE